jgi:hypothetical protein
MIRASMSHNILHRSWDQISTANGLAALTGHVHLKTARPSSRPPWSQTSSRPIHKTRGEHQATGVLARQPAVGTRCRRSARFHGAGYAPHLPRRPRDDLCRRSAKPLII